jgi:putative ABC transport system ATP-binding protein
MSLLATPLSTSMPKRDRPARPTPVLSLKGIGVPGGTLSLQAEVGDIVRVEGLAPAAAWRILAIAAGYAFSGPGRSEHGGIDTGALTASQRTALRSRMVARAMLRDDLDASCRLLDNVLAPALARGVPTTLARQQALHALESLGLLSLQHEPAVALSPAQQRLGVLARALACHAPLLVLERPETDLDDGQLALLRNAIWLAAFDTRSCVLMSTGDASLASLAQRRVAPVGRASAVFAS